MSDATYFIYLEENPVNGWHPAWFIANSVEDMCRNLYNSKRLHDDYWADGVGMHVHQKLGKITRCYDPCQIGSRTAHVFKFIDSKAAQRIVFVVNGVHEDKSMEVNDLVFDIILKKGSKTIPPLTYSEGSRFVTLIELEKSDSTPMT